MSKVYQMPVFCNLSWSKIKMCYNKDCPLHVSNKTDEEDYISWPKYRCEKAGMCSGYKGSDSQ